MRPVRNGNDGLVATSVHPATAVRVKTLECRRFRRGRVEGRDVRSGLESALHCFPCKRPPGWADSLGKHDEMARRELAERCGLRRFRACEDPLKPARAKHFRSQSALIAETHLLATPQWRTSASTGSMPVGVVWFQGPKKVPLSDTPLVLSGPAACRQDHARPQNQSSRSHAFYPRVAISRRPSRASTGGNGSSRTRCPWRRR